MTDLVWMKVYIGSEMARTADLTPEEFGCFERLRRHYWLHGGLPVDDARIMRITGCTPDRWEDVRSAICGLFAEDWTLPDLDKELAEAGAKRAKAVERSAKAHAARYGKRPPAPHAANGSASSNASSTATSSAYGSASGSEQAADKQCFEHAHQHQHQTQYAEDEGRGTTPHTREEDAGPIYLDPPESEDECRRWLSRQGLGPKGMGQALQRFRDGRLSREMLDQILISWGAS